LDVNKNVNSQINLIFISAFHPSVFALLFSSSRAKNLLFQKKLNLDVKNLDQNQITCNKFLLKIKYWSEFAKVTTALQPRGIQQSCFDEKDDKFWRINIYSG